MSTTKGVKVKYKGSTIHDMPGDGEFKLLTKASYLEDDLDIQVERDANLDSKAITANGSYSAASDELDGYDEVTVNVPNSYSESDEGKVVDDGALVAQTSTTKNANGTYDTTLNNEVVVNVPNSYTQSDEGKVVDGGALVAQTSRTIDENGTYDTTLNDEVTVNVSGGGGGGGVYEDIPVNEYAVGHTPSINASSAKSGGNLFILTRRIKISKIRVYPRTTIASAYIRRVSDGVNVVAIENQTVVSEQWNDLELQTPVVLEEGVQYLIWYSTNGTALKYKSNTTPSLDYVEYLGARYSTSANTVPTSADSSNTLVYGIDFYVDSYSVVHEAVLTTKNITQNGTYSASDDNADGYSEVTVDVANNILSGTDAPTASVGGDRDIYLRYDSNNEIVSAYCKVNGAWQMLEGTDIGDVNTD